MKEEGSPMASQDTEAILQQARERAEAEGRGFEGEVTPEEAHALIQAAGARLVDVRTQAERDFVGYPTIGEHVEWETYPGMEYNPDFPAQLRRAVGDDPEQYLVFMCRSGGRSAKAAEAMTKQGYEHCFNLIGGFEGGKDEQGHRGTKAGWKVAGLPWQQE
jgi:rhodanese-related sulfurtransferase